MNEQNPDDSGWNPDVRLSDARELAAQKDEKEKRELDAKGTHVFNFVFTFSTSGIMNFDRKLCFA